MQSASILNGRQASLASPFGAGAQNSENNAGIVQDTSSTHVLAALQALQQNMHKREQDPNLNENEFSHTHLHKFPLAKSMVFSPQHRGDLSDDVQPVFPTFEHLRQNLALSQVLSKTATVQPRMINL